MIVEFLSSTLVILILTFEKLLAVVKHLPSFFIFFSFYSTKKGLMQKGRLYLHKLFEIKMHFQPKAQLRSVNIITFLCSWNSWVGNELKNHGNNNIEIFSFLFSKNRFYCLALWMQKYHVYLAHFTYVRKLMWSSADRQAVKNNS